MNIQLTRRALLIGCDGGDNTRFLPGVKNDLRNFRRFLRSDRAGSWKDDEIIQLQNCTMREVQNAIASSQGDYLFVYFSGHGRTNSLGQRMLALTDGLISDLELINDSPRQLIIVDACRDRVNTGLSGAPTFDDKLEHFDGGDYSYQLFNECVALSPEGRIIIHATQSGETSADTPSGGIFSKALLRVASTIRYDSDYLPTSIETILAHMPGSIAYFGGNQKPEIVYREGNLKVPFTFSKKAVAPITSASSRISSTDVGLAFAFSIVAICLLVAIASE